MACMDNLTLHMDTINLDKTRISQGYSIGGIVYVTIGDIVFPGEKWYDMVFSDLQAWLPELISFGQNHTDSCVLAFMDGPCVLKLNRQSDGIIYACGYRNNKIEIKKTNINFFAFLKSVAGCIRKYDRILYENDLPAQFQAEQSKLRDIVRRNDGSIS